VLTYFVIFVMLFATWVVLSGKFSVFFLGIGVVVCLLAALVAVCVRGGDIKLKSFLRTMVYWPFYFMWLFKEVVVASIFVTCRVWKVDIVISPVFAWVPVTNISDFGLTVFANSITITPGTVSVSVADDKIRVHVLVEEKLADLKKGDMEKKVKQLCGEA